MESQSTHARKAVAVNSEIRNLVMLIGLQLRFADAELDTVACRLEDNQYKTCESLADLHDDEAAQMGVPSQLLRALRAEALRRNVSTAVASASALAARSLKVHRNPSFQELLQTSEEATALGKSQNAEQADSDRQGEAHAQSESSSRPAEMGGNESTRCQAVITSQGQPFPDSIAMVCPEWTSSPGTSGQPNDVNDTVRSTAVSSNLHDISQTQGSDELHQEILEEAGAGSPALNSINQPLVHSQRTIASLQRQGQQPRQSQLVQPRLRERGELQQATRPTHSHSRSTLAVPRTSQQGVQASSGATRRHANAAVSPNKDQVVKQVEVEKRGSGSLATTAASSTSAAICARTSGQQRQALDNMTTRNTNLTKQPWRGAAQKSDVRGTSAPSKTASSSPAAGRPGILGSYQNAVLSPRGARDGSMTAPARSTDATRINQSMTARPASPPRREGESPRALSPRMSSSRRPESPRLGRSMSSHTLSKSVRTESPRLQKSALSSSGTQEQTKRKAAGTRPESPRGSLATTPSTAPRRLLGASREDVAPAPLSLQASKASNSAMTPHHQQVGPSVLQPPHSKSSLSLDLDGSRKPRSISETEACPTPLSMLDRSQEGTQSSPRLQTLSSSPSAFFVGAGYARQHPLPIQEHPLPIPGMGTTYVDGSPPLRSRRPNSPPGQSSSSSVVPAVAAMRGAAAVPGSIAMATTRMSNVAQPGWSTAELARQMAAKQ